MSKANEPAYPINDENCSLRQRTDSPFFMQGLTKLEYFAAAAMQGLVACPNIKEGTTGQQYAEVAVELAKNLIAELEKVAP